MTDLNFPQVDEPVQTALHQAVDYVLNRWCVWLFERESDKDYLD